MQYSSILNNFSTYSSVLSSYSTYADVLSGTMSGAAFGEYELQVFKYQPLAYWYVTTSENAAIEPSIYGSDAELSKTAGTDGYKPIVYSTDPGTNILFENDYLLIPTIEFNKIHIAKKTYEKQPFSINFWYKNLNGTIDSEIPIFRIGDLGDYRITLSTKNGRILLDFLGQKSYYEVLDYRDIYNISIVFDGTNSKLMVNGNYGTIISEKTKDFDTAVSVLLQSGAGCVSIFSHITMYGYAISQAQAQTLYRIGTNTSVDLGFLYNFIGGTTFTDAISDFNKTIDYSISENNLITRNCYFLNNQLFLRAKNMASINGATFATSKYNFSGSSNISFNIFDGDVDRNNASFKISSPAFSTSSGTALYIDCSQPIYVKFSTGTVDVYSTTSSQPIYSQSLSSQTYIAVEFINSQIWVNLGGIKTNTGVTAPLSFKSVVIGNNGLGTDAYSDGITNFTLNYAENPLQIGIYSLDLSTSHTNYIKPKQDGVALFDFIATQNTTINYATFKSSGGAEVQVFDSTNTVDEYYACLNGTAVKDGGTAFTIPLASDTAILMSARLYDNTFGESYADIDLPKISNFKYLGYSTNTIFANNSPALISSTEDFSYVPSHEYNNGMFIKTNNHIDVDIVEAAKQVAFYMKVDSIPNTSDIFEFAGTTLRLTKISSTTYKLSVDNAATLYVNGVSYASGVQSSNLYQYDDVYVAIVLSSAQTTDPYFLNSSNIHISNLCISNASTTKMGYALGKLHKSLMQPNIIAVTDGDTLSLTDSIIGKAFTSNIVFSG